MTLYLVRHGVQDQNQMGNPLSQQGIEEVEKVGAYLNSKDLTVQFIFHSGLKRAEETSIILSKFIHCENGIFFQQGMTPLDDVTPTVAFIYSFNDDIMLVGHMPFMHILASNLLGMAPGNGQLDFSTATILALEKKGDEWQFVWKVGPSNL